MFCMSVIAKTYMQDLPATLVVKPQEGRKFYEYQ